VTLRGRLTTAFLAVVLGPVLLGAFFVGSAVSAVSADRALERLDRAVSAAATSIEALCRQLDAAAGAVAIVAAGPARQAAAERIVAGGLGSAVQIAGPSGRVILTTANAPARPWTDCAGGPSAPSALAARVELRDRAGAPLGSVTVASAIDHTLVHRLAGAAGAAVTLLGTSPDGGTTAVHSTEPDDVRDAVVRAAATLASGRTASTGDRYVRRIGPGAGQPLALVLSVPRRAPQGLYALLAVAVVLTGAFVVVLAWWLARSTTRPLAALAHAADRVAGGDLSARVPVRGQDEAARLAATFNRMTRETQAYVQALTASRDQLRGHLAILGDTLSSTHDLDRILPVILQTAVAATGARAGAVLLLEPGTATLVGRCAEGLEERWPADVTEADPTALRVPLGGGVLGRVAATGIPLRGHVDRDGPALSAYEPRCRTYVAVPFSMPAARVGDRPAAGDQNRSSALGVLALYDRLGSDEFDDSDVTTLRTFAGQAAVAVDNVRAHEEAQRLSLTDPLTGLWNYRYLQESVRREVERASRFHRMLTVLALDLDRFKEVNDTYGHAAGDAVLVEFARRVRLALREVDLAFRQGGEEFVVLLPETDRAGGVVVAERLGAIIRSEPVPVEPGELIPVTVSIGVAVFPDDGALAAQVLAAADDALYAAKAAGRDTYRVAALDASGVPAGAGGAPGGPQPPRQSRGR
jgi:diguanylate cyclase (GGDEF)-like protein